MPEEEIVTKVPVKKVPNKNSSEFIREKSSSATPDNSESVDKKEDSSDELGSLSSKLLDKLAEEESKLKKINNLEIGTWSNEMAEKVENSFDDADEVSVKLKRSSNVLINENCYIWFCVLELKEKCLNFLTSDACLMTLLDNFS